jgi:hypothetical protein
MGRSNKATEPAPGAEATAETPALMEPTVTESVVTTTGDPVEDMKIPKGHAVLIALDADGNETGSLFHVLWNASAQKNYGDETKFKLKKKPTSPVK